MKQPENSDSGNFIAGFFTWNEWRVFLKYLYLVLKDSKFFYIKLNGCEYHAPRI